MKRTADDYKKWKSGNNKKNESASTIDHHNINNSPSNNKFNNNPFPGKETSTSLKKIKPRPLNKKKDEKKGILNTLDFFNKMPLSLRKKATEEEKKEATAQVKKKKTPQSLKPDKLRHGKRQSRLKFRQNVKIKNQVTTNRKKRAAEAKKKDLEIAGKTYMNVKQYIKMIKEAEVNAKGRKGKKPETKEGDWRDALNPVWR